MHFFSKVVIVVTSVSLLTGCANMTHLTRQRTIAANGNGTTGQIFFIDAKQRVVLNRNGQTCAEPSPDALSAIAASQSLNLTQGDNVELGSALSVAEAAGSIGLRTQSIQLMRDEMFRLCEARQNGAISQMWFELMHRRLQSTMVAILAIEQLTGAVRAPTIVLGGNGATGNAESLVRLTTQRETLAASVSAGQAEVRQKTTARDTAAQELATAEMALTGANDANRAALTTARDTARTKKTGAEEALSAAQVTLAGREAALSSIDRAMTSLSMASSAGANGTIESTNRPGPGEVEAIATAVQQIVDGVVSMRNSSDLCVSLIVQSAQNGSEIDTSSPVFQLCLGQLQSQISQNQQPPQ